MLVTSSDTALLRLLQLSSVSLPVGGYAFSQGLEYAIENEWVNDEVQVQQWIDSQISQGLAQLDLPILRLSLLALTAGDKAALITLNQLVLANRESKELRLSDSAMGEALTRVLRQQQITVPFDKKTEVSFVILFAIAAHHWQIHYHNAALGFCWSWLENQVAAATKLVPLGQSQAQRLLGNLQPALINAVADAQGIEREQIGMALPALAIASAKHETQYTRIFRS